MTAVRVVLIGELPKVVACNDKGEILIALDTLTAVEAWLSKQGIKDYVDCCLKPAHLAACERDRRGV